MNLPPWLQPADPARYAAEGQRLALSGQEASKRAQNEGAAGERADQELKIRQQQLEAQATAAAQKYAAQREYQQAIASGQDPVQAILRYGPAMGEGTDAAAAIRATAMRQPKPFTPPSIQMQRGPDGTQIPILVQNGRASVIPQSAYKPKPQVQPEQWQEVTRKINGRDVPGQQSSKTGLFKPYPAGEQAGAVTPQARLQASTLSKRKAALEKTIQDPLATMAMAKAKATKEGRKATQKDMTDAESALQKEIDAIDKQIDQLMSGGEAAKPEAGESKVLKFTRDKSGKLVLSTGDADNSGH